MLTRFLLAAVGLCALADAVGDARRAIQADLNTMADASKRFDMVTYFRFYGPDFRTTSGDTVRNLEQGAPTLGAFMKASRTEAMLHAYRMTIKRLTLKGGQAIVTYRQDTQGELSGPGVAHPKALSGATLKTAIWKKYGGHWLIAAEPGGD